MIDLLNRWIREVELILKHGGKKLNWERILEDHRSVISFLQHERLIHLLVTLTIGVMFLGTVLCNLVLESMILLWVNILFLVLLIPYIWHYFRLENGVQRLYFLDLEIQKRFSGDHD